MNPARKQEPFRTPNSHLPPEISGYLKRTTLGVPKHQGIYSLSVLSLVHSVFSIFSEHENYSTGLFPRMLVFWWGGEMNCLEYSLVPVLGSSILLLPQKIWEPDPPSPQCPGSLLSQSDTSTQGFEPKTNREIQEEKVRIQMQWSQWWYLAETVVSWPDYYKQNIVAPPPNTLD